jgi:hypothetical protein
MQARQLKSLIDTYRRTLAASGAEAAAKALGPLSEAVGKGGQRSVATFLGAVEHAMPNRDTASETVFANLVPSLRGLLALLTEARAQKTVVADLKRLLDLLERRSDVSKDDFDLRAVRSVASASRTKAVAGAPTVDTKQLVESYLKRLEAALGNDALFRSIYRELNDDKNITQVEAVELASRFLEPTARSSTRPKALKKELYRHERLLDAREAARSIGGPGR